MNSIQYIKTIFPDDYPYLLKHALSDIKNAPKKLYIRGVLPPDNLKFLTVVGSRRYTEYGKTVCENLIAGLRGLPVVIISGLAFGIDSIAHEAALKNGIKTIAVPGSGLADEMIYPAAHVGLAKRILEAGGALLSPFEETVMGNDWTFPYRNGIMAGMAHATLVIEADLKSGTLITARRALDYSRDVLVVPGSIFSTKSRGSHYYMRQGATPITCVNDLIEALGFDLDENVVQKSMLNRTDLTPDERIIVEALTEPLPREVLIESLNMETAKVNSLLSALEIKGVIEEKLGELWLI